MSITSNKFANQNELRLFLLRGTLQISLLFIILILFTIWAEKIDLDRRFSATFFSPEKFWFLAEEFPWKILYEYGEIPGIIFSIICFLLLIGLPNNSLKAPLKRYLLICSLTPFIASLLLVNIVLKDHTGRPRPREIKEFQGTWDYKPVLKSGIPGKGHSFPCGHCSIAFTLTSGIIFWRISRKFALLSFFLGLSYGVMMSIARIVQGGHFLGDAVWSLGVVWLTLLILYYFVFQPPLQSRNSANISSKKQKWNIICGISILIFILIIFVWTRRPFYKEHSGSFEISKNIKRLNIYLPKKWMFEEPLYEPGNNVKFNMQIRGFAPPYTTHYLSFTTVTTGATTKLKFKEDIIGYHRDIRQNIVIRLPEHVKVSLNQL